MTISESISEDEAINKVHYVYLTLPLYNNIAHCFKRRMSISAMLGYAKITRSKWEKLTRKYPKLIEMIEVWKGVPEAKASENIVDAINSGDLDTSKWASERWNREDYGKKDSVDINVNGTVTHEIDYKKSQEIRERLLSGANSSENERRHAKEAEYEIVENTCNE